MKASLQDEGVHQRYSSHTDCCHHELQLVCICTGKAIKVPIVGKCCKTDHHNTYVHTQTDPRPESEEIDEEAFKKTYSISKKKICLRTN